MIRSVLLFTLFFLSVTPLCYGFEFPATWKYESKIDRKQYGKTTVSIDKHGKVKASTIFSNGKKIDGDHFVARIAIYTSENYPILCLQYAVGLNPAGFGKAREKRIEKTEKIDTRLLTLVDHVGISHSTIDVVPDKLFWKNAGKFGITAVRAYLGDPVSAQKVAVDTLQFYVELNGVLQERTKPPDCKITEKASLQKKKKVRTSNKSTDWPTSFKFFDEVLCQTPSCDSWVVQ